MFKKLTYSVVFPTNGISFSGTHTFQPGITAVTGENGTGKSFTTIELMRFALYGKKALRGPAPDYKQLDIDALVAIRGEDYQIIRNRKTEKLIKVATDEVLAVNTEAVNAKLRELMGFPLEVFDVANAAVQKKVEAFSQLAPTARRKMVDDLVGLTQQESVEKACRDEAKGFRREAEAIAKALRPVVQPVVPQGYRPSAEIEAEIANERELVRRRNALQRVIDSVGPVPATVEPVDETAVEALEAHEQNRMEMQARFVQLGNAIAAIPDAAYTAEQLDAAEQLIAYNEALARRPAEPPIDRVVIEQQLNFWDEWLAAQSAMRVETECPKCGHHFNTGGDPLPAPSEYNPTALRGFLAVWDRLDEPLPSKPDAEWQLSAREIATYRVALARSEEKAKMIAELDALVLPEDKSAQLKSLRDDLAAYRAYEKARFAYEQRSNAAREAEEALKALAQPRTDMVELEALFVAARVYESELAGYEQAKAEFDRMTQEVAKGSELADKYKAGADALAAARATLKAHLAPSFSHIASSLISQMTAGKLNHILIDEEMNISVDGQDLTTLSGAGETVANLALRIALGQVLVSKVFPVFIGDEIDSDMDPSRAQATADCFDRLRDRMQQIILITHKPVEYADHVIEMQ